MTTHEIYLVKKSAAKIVMQAKGIKFQEAFDSIPDESVVSKDYNALAESILSGVQPKKKKSK